MTLHPEAETLRQLDSDDPANAWREFLEQYSSHLYQVCRISCADAEDGAECFVFVCEQLAANRFRRLRRFTADGRASFRTWLQAVTKNLCVDWHRKNKGRRRPFRSIAELPALEQEIFHLYFERHMNLQSVLEDLRPHHEGLSAEVIEETVERLRHCLSRAQLWELASRDVKVHSLDSSIEDLNSIQLTDSAPDPEAVTAKQEALELMTKALQKLSPEEKVIIRLRYEEDLTLQEIANLTGLKDPQAVDRKLRSALAQLRRSVSGSSVLAEKLAPRPCNGK